MEEIYIENDKRIVYQYAIIGYKCLLIMIMIIFIHIKYTLQTMAKNKRQSPNLGIPLGSYLADNNNNNNMLDVSLFFLNNGFENIRPTHIVWEIIFWVNINI